MPKPSDSNDKLTMRSAWLGPGSPIWPVILLPIVMLLAGCETQPTVPCVTPKVPTMPVDPEPPRSSTFSDDVQASLQTWRQLLTASPATSKR